MTIQSPPGVFDILPDDSKEPWRSSHLWQHLESILRKTSQDFGYKEIRTPIFEKSELFSRSVGQQTDIVSKEMYTFEDRGGRSLSLRPEGTASTIRAWIEHHLDQNPGNQKLFYIGPMFRYERMQAGRFRQFHQYGAEAIGFSCPEIDVEMIDLAYTIYSRLGLKDLSIQLSSLGSKESRGRFKEGLKKYLSQFYDQLSEDSQRRFETNPLRIIDSKDPNDQKILKNAPSILDFLDSTSKDHFADVLKLLNSLKIPYVINKDIVRGLDYYNDTVFEIVSGELGSQNSIGGGGRYDTLIEELGGQPAPGIGFATGMERILQVALKQNGPLPSPHAPTLYLIPLGEKAKQAGFSLVHNLRLIGISAEMEVTGKKIGKAMQLANNLEAQYVIVLGDKELEEGIVSLKEMATGEVSMIPLQSLAKILQLAEKQEDYLTFMEEISTPFKHATETDFFFKKMGGSIKQTTQAVTRLKTALDDLKEIL
jgi:histidyl-tRNA synthetase